MCEKPRVCAIQKLTIENRNRELQFRKLQSQELLSYHNQKLPINSRNEFKSCFRFSHVLKSAVRAYFALTIFVFDARVSFSFDYFVIFCGVCSVGAAQRSYQLNWNRHKPLIAQIIRVAGRQSIDSISLVLVQTYWKKEQVGRITFLPISLREHTHSGQRSTEHKKTDDEMDPQEQHSPNDTNAHQESAESLKKQQNSEDHKTQGAFDSFEFIPWFVRVFHHAKFAVCNAHSSI